MTNLYTIAGVLTGCFLMISAGLSESSYGLYASWFLKEEERNYSQIITFILAAKIGKIIGSLMYSLSAESIGRKYTITAMAVPLMISSIILQISSEYIAGCIAIFIAGVSIGGAYSVLPVYIGEMADESSRGRLISFLYPSYVLGLFLSSVISSFFGDSTQLSFTNYLSSFLSFAAAVVSAIILSETPYYCFKTGKPMIHKNGFKDKCMPVNALLGQNKIRDEFYDIVNHVPHKAEYSIFLKHRWLKPMLLMMALYILTTLSGIYTFTSHSLIVRSFYDVDLHPIAKNLIIGGAKLATSFLILFMVDLIGRKLCLMISFAAYLYSLILFLILVIVKTNLYYLFLIVLHIFYTAVNIGIGPIPFVLLGEIFPLNKKMICVGLCTTVSTILDIILVLLETQIIDLFYKYPYIDIYVSIIVTIISLIVVKLCYFETKGKRLAM